MIKLASVFSGIGAIEQALEKIKMQKKINYDIIFACDNGERDIKQSFTEIEEETKNLTYSEKQKFVKELYGQTKRKNYVKINYFKNYKISEDQWYEDIRFIDGTRYKNNINLLVGGSPCQSFSIMGNRKGLTDERGILVFEYIRLIKEIEPEVFIFENVPGLLSKKETWEIVEKEFKSTGYTIYSDILNAIDFGIPQNRKRLFLVGFKNNPNSFEFPEGEPTNKTVFDFLEDKVDYLYYLGKKGFEFVTNPKNYARARVNHSVMRAQRANQQYNWNGDFIFEKLDLTKHDEKILSRAYVGEFQGEKGVVRQLTPRECLRLMGFPDSFKFEGPNSQIYRQAGNSIVVNVLEEILKSILKVVDFNEKKN